LYEKTSYLFYLVPISSRGIRLERLYYTLLYNNPNLLNSTIIINETNGIPASNYKWTGKSPCHSKSEEFGKPVINQTDDKFNEVFEMVLESYKKPKADFDKLQQDIKKRITDKTGRFQKFKQNWLKRGKYIHVVVFTDYDLYT
jgi:hypothetical protein